MHKTMQYYNKILDAYFKNPWANGYRYKQKYCSC